MGGPWPLCSGQGLGATGLDLQQLSQELHRLEMGLLDIKFLVPSTTSLFPLLSHNNKTIFFIVVDICDHEPTASKRG